MSFFGLFLCLAVFAIGDILGVGTRAKLSSVFVALMLFLIGFLTGIFPKNIIDQAGLSQIAKWASPFIIFHMGTRWYCGNPNNDRRSNGERVVAGCGSRSNYIRRAKIRGDTAGINFWIERG